MKLNIKTFILNLILISVLGCGDKNSKQPVVAVPTDGSPPPAAQPAGKSTSTTSQNTGAQKSLLLFSGGHYLEEELETLTSEAREAIPRHLQGQHFQFIDPEPLLRPGYIAATGCDQYFQSKCSLQLVNLATNNSYTLYQDDSSSVSTPFPSPDGKWIAFVEESYKTGRKKIRVINVDSGNVTDVSSPDQADDLHPRFSTNGRILTFERESNAASAIMAVSFSEGSVGDLKTLVAASQGQSVNHFRFSPNQKSFVYTRRNGRTSLLFLALSGRETQITLKNENSFEPTWSPDGKSVLYWNSSKEAQSIKSYDVGTGSSRVWTNITIPKGFNGEEPGADYSRVCPNWSPDMKEIYYTSGGDYWDQILKVSTVDLKVTHLTDPNFPIPYFCPRVIANYE